MRVLPWVVLASFLVNTHAGTFRCNGPLVRLDSKGVPSSGEQGSMFVPCVRIIENRETISWQH